VRILLVSDLHYTLRQFDWLVEAAAAFDLVVIAGDHLDISSTVPLATQSFVVCNFVSLVAARTRVVVSSGNHDLTGTDADGEHAALWMEDLRAAGVPTDGDSILLDDTLVTICPWWDGPIGRERVARQFGLDGARRPARWIWVYHWPPTDSPTTWTGKRHYGDADLGAWIAEHRPDMVFGGHVHGPPFRQDGAWADRIGPTWVFNPGRQIGPTPTSVEIDLDAGTATWSSMLGTEIADLRSDSPPERTVF